MKCLLKWPVKNSYKKWHYGKIKNLWFLLSKKVISCRCYYFLSFIEICSLVHDIFWWQTDTKTWVKSLVFTFHRWVIILTDPSESSELCWMGQKKHTINLWVYFFYYSTFKISLMFPIEQHLFSVESLQHHPINSCYEVSDVSLLSHTEWYRSLNELDSWGGTLKTAFLDDWLFVCGGCFYI